MTVCCPSCDTAYRVPSRILLGDHPSFRCSRCDHVFEPEFAVEPPPPALPAAPAGDVERDLLDDDVDSDDADDASAADEEAAPGRRSPARFALRAVLAVTLGFALLSIYVFMHRAHVIEVLAQVPVVGPDLAAMRLNPAHVQLTDIRGQYTRVQGDTLVFVVTGRAVNNAPVPVSAIEIQGSVEGTREQRRLVFAGAAPHQVTDLTPREIDLLQTLQPPQGWRLLPGEESDFLLAFVDPPIPLREFAVEVSSVRRRRLPVTEQ